jgi:hypothetical protein
MKKYQLSFFAASLIILSFGCKGQHPEANDNLVQGRIHVVTYNTIDVPLRVVMHAEITNNSKAAICLNARTFPVSSAFYPFNLIFLDGNFPSERTDLSDEGDRFDILNQANSTVVVALPKKTIQGASALSDYGVFVTGKRYRIRVTFNYVDCRLLEKFSDLSASNEIWQKSGKELIVETTFNAP